MSFTMIYDGWYRARRNGTEWVDSCPCALAARMYRMDRKDLQPPRLGYQPTQPTTTPKPKRSNAELALIWTHAEVRRLIVEIGAADWRERLRRSTWPNSVPPYATRWSIAGGVSVYPDVDGVGSWGRAVRIWEDSQ